ncbi:MAG: hypothetical protein IJY18_03950 [Clostridia bacterium]|nr:hypothetical protein [Clostridia bacterium]
MKKIIYAITLLALALALTLSSCAAKGGSESQKTPLGEGKGDESGIVGVTMADGSDGVNIPSEALSFYTSGDSSVKLSLDNLRLNISLASGSLPALAESESAASAIYGIEENAAANETVGYYRVAYAESKLYVMASDTESLNLAKDIVLAFATPSGIVIPADLNESGFFNKPDLRVGKLTLYTEAEAKALPLLKSLTVGGEALSGFLSTKTVYAVKNDAEGYPTVGADALIEGAEVEVTQASALSLGVASVKVKLGEAEKVYNVKFYRSDAAVDAEIVQKDGAGGTICFVIDDGTESTANFMVDNILGKAGYENIYANFALITKKLADLSVVTDEEGNKVYDIDENGRYKYTEIAGKFDFWRNVLATDKAYIVSHTHTHNYPGENDNGGIFGYKKNNGTYANTSDLPKGHIQAELVASNQIIEDISGYRSGTIIRAGVGASVSQYFYNRVIDSGEYFAARGNSMPTNPNSLIFYPDTIKNRLSITSYMIEHYTSSKTNPTTSSSTNAECLAAGIDLWTDFMDTAVETGGWASFCIHEIRPDDWTGTDHHIYESQAKEFFAHANAYGERAWIASYDEAAKYFLEWSTATVTTELLGGKTITVSLTTEETDERMDMPLTVKVSVPDSWSAAALGDSALEIMTDDDGNRYVLVNVKPGATVAISGTVNAPEEAPTTGVK